MPVILATQEAEIRRIVVRSQPEQIVHKTLFQKILPQKSRAGGVAQGKGPKFKPQYCEKKKELSTQCAKLRYWQDTQGKSPVRGRI
jgi:hypothetical protein